MNFSSPDIKVYAGNFCHQYHKFSLVLRGGSCVYHYKIANVSDKQDHSYWFVQMKFCLLDFDALMT